MNCSLPPLPDDLMATVSSYLSQEEALDFSRNYPGTFFGERTYLKITSDSIYRIFDELVQIDELGETKPFKTKEITSLKISNKQFSNGGFIWFIQKFNSLKRLDVHGCYKLTDRALRAIAKYCPKLQYLNAYACPQFTRRAIKDVRKSCLDLEWFFTGVPKC